MVASRPCSAQVLDENPSLSFFKINYVSDPRSDEILIWDQTTGTGIEEAVTSS